MSWNLSSDRPIYIQVLEILKLRIVTEIYPSGGQLPAVRELAVEAGVNPNTMQKALSELERGGLVYSVRTSGRFVSDNKELIKSVKRDMAQNAAGDFLRSMKSLGITKEEIIKIIEESDEP